MSSNCSADDLDVSVKERWHDPECNSKPENLRQVCGAELDALRG